MKKASGAFIGLLFIIVGLLYACSALDFIDFTIFFPGWWTLFIIVPCIYALTRKKEDKTGPVIGLIIGICFLINAQDWRFHIDFFPMALAALCFVIGWKLLVPQKKKDHKQVEVDFTYSTDSEPKVNVTADSDGTAGPSFNSTSAGGGTYTGGNGYINASAFFGGKDIRVDNECFTGADITVIMGAVDLEDYDYSKESQTKIRATEGTVISRIPPPSSRSGRVRKGAGYRGGI